jgi:NAD(P)-dependent dehydrogenase (short-subunit alcohol dehydrogenase family)
MPPSVFDAAPAPGSVVLVTGGTRSIGRAIAEGFLGSGAEVEICARNPPAETVERDGRSAVFTPCDVRDPDQVAALVEGVVARRGRLDVLVNNAGGAPPAPSATASPRFNEKIVALNLLAPLMLAQAVHPVMVGQPDGGVIINVSSVSGMRANPTGAAYGAAKAGLLNLTETLAVEWGPAIRVVALTLGLIVTEEAGVYYGDADGLASVSATIPLGRMGTPADAAAACLFLASPAAAWMSGTNLVLHGGGERPAYLGASTGAVTQLG